MMEVQYSFILAIWVCAAAQGNIGAQAFWSGTTCIYLPGKTCPLKEAYVPDQRLVSRSLVSTNSSNTSLEGFKRGCCCHSRQQVVSLPG